MMRYPARRSTARASRVWPVRGTVVDDDQVIGNGDRALHARDRLQQKFSVIEARYDDRQSRIRRSGRRGEGWWTRFTGRQIGDRLHLAQQFRAFGVRRGRQIRDPGARGHQQRRVRDAFDPTRVELDAEARSDQVDGELRARAAPRRR